MPVPELHSGSPLAAARYLRPRGNTSVSEAAAALLIGTSCSRATAATLAPSTSAPSHAPIVIRGNTAADDSPEVQPATASAPNRMTARQISSVFTVLQDSGPAAPPGIDGHRVTASHRNPYSAAIDTNSTMAGTRIPIASANGAANNSAGTEINDRTRERPAQWA